MNKISLTDQQSLYELAINYPGFRPLIRDLITESEWVYWWGMNIGDRDIMWGRIIDPLWIEIWNDWFK